MSDGDDVRGFAVRRVNPFDGVLQVVETPTARAYSADGEIWQVQVLAERPEHTWHSGAGTLRAEQFFNFGRWTADAGLRDIPANPMLDIGRMHRAAAQLTDALKPLTAHLPFRLSDRFECWSTDPHARPVALLASAEHADLTRDLRVPDWRAATLRSQPGSPHATTATAPDVALIERGIHALGADRCWFERAPDGSARRLFTGDDWLPSTLFPALGVPERWSDADVQACMDDYIASLAPRLLLLQHIDDATRRRLELAACRNATALAAVFRLIPRVIERERLEAARVEAKLRCAQR